MVSKRNLILSFVAVFVIMGAAFSGVSSHAAMIDKVVVEVNGEVITQREFDRIFIPVKTRIEASFKGDELRSRLEMARKGVLEQMINSKIAISEAKKEKVEIDEAELAKRIETIEGYYGNREEFLKALADKGTNFSEFEKEIREQMLAQDIVQKEVSGKISVAPGEVSDLYEKNKEKLTSPKSYKVKTMMIRKTDETNQEANRKKMEGIRKDLKKGADFTDTATAKSEGPFAQKKGDMGFVIKGQLAPQLEEVVFNLKKGELSEVIETPIGFHVFTVEEIQESRQLSLDEVNDFLKDQIYKKKFEEKLVGWLEKKRKNAHISYK